ncbi:MAG: DHH family phosphoesterase [Lachnospiraceae bacterium]|nr:DHH family phosphoesterase [Lachnospiraceae bacterium]
MNKMKIDKRLNNYLRWPLYLSVLLICMNLIVYCVSTKAGVIVTGFLFIYIISAVALFLARKQNIMAGLINYASDYSQVQRHLMRELAIPYAMLDTEGRLMWGNDEFIDLSEETKHSCKYIWNIFPEITVDMLPVDMIDQEMHITWRDRNYKIVLRRIKVDNFDEKAQEKKIEIEEENILITLYMQEETELIAYQQELEDCKLIVGLLYIDNYEEALDNVDEVRASLLLALIDRKVNKYMQTMDAIVKKLEKDKYVFMFKKKYLKQLENSKFSILEEVRAISIGDEMALTVSIGLGISDDGYLRSYEYARAAMDLALGRGGDQAVVKAGEKLTYYGGKSVQIEKKTRVKARVKAHALRELMEAKERVVIMGHKTGDVDCFGAAIGVYRISTALGKKTHIVINEITTSVRPLMQRFQCNAEYEDDMFLNSQEALDVVDYNTLLVIVDVHRPNLTECPELLQKTRHIVVLDHHRQSGDVVENAVLSYIEPYASSACEMVAEILQYIEDNLKLRQVEADAMYAGMMIDTNNFLTKTGVRTFEAAAFLRRCGADITRVRKMFRSSNQEYQIRAKSISQMEIYLEHYAITECKADGVESPTVLGAQVANELLNISEVKASFVLTAYNNMIYVSARSIDELNVQVVMEKLGGGGHMSVAATQLRDVDMPRAKQMIRDVLFYMYNEGEL